MYEIVRILRFFQKNPVFLPFQDLLMFSLHKKINYKKHMCYTGFFRC